MSDEFEDDVFPLFSPDVIRAIRDRNTFCDYVEDFYAKSAEDHGCSISISRRRIGEAHDYWLGDEERFLAFDADSKSDELDHFKHAGIIGYWLRRLVPINDIFFMAGDSVRAVASNDVNADDIDGTPDQIFFYRFGNELCALFAGFYICLAYELPIKVERRLGKGSNVAQIPGEVGIKELPQQFISEFPKLLKTKTMSTNSLYMTYRSLFDTLVWQFRPRART